MHRATFLVVLAVAACKHDGSDLCARAVHHVIDMASMTELAPPSADEQRAIDAVVSATTDKCRDEGLSQAQADCITASHWPDWDDQLRGCPAFATKPPSWVILRPPRDERIQLAKLVPTPDGPREGPGHYRQLVGDGATTCGLATDGDITCWGQPPKQPFPAGHFTQLARTSHMACALDTDGHVHCRVAEPDIPDRAPTDALSTFALDAYRGCGIRKADQGLVCWNDLDDPPWSLPAGTFTQVVLTHAGGCALRTDRKLACFGDQETPPGTFLAIASDNHVCGLATDGSVHCWPRSKNERPLTTPLATLSCARNTCCGLTADHQIACTTGLLGPPPPGSFESISVLGDVACAVRTGTGGTVCWGENETGACNVPQS